MNYSASILDNASALINFKNRNGFNIVSGSANDVRRAYNSLEKELTAKLTKELKLDFDLKVTIENIMKKCKDLETIEQVREYVSESSVTNIFEGAQKIQGFMRSVRGFTA